MYIVSFIYDEEKMAVTLYNVPHSNSKHTAFEFHPSRPYFARYYTIFSYSFRLQKYSFLGVYMSSFIRIC